MPFATGPIPDESLCAALKNRDLSQKEGKELANKSLYVGNLPYSTGEDELREMFDQYGPVAEVRIIQNKGFGFVEVPEENMQAAIDGTDGTEVGGRTIKVNEARPREERGGGGRGFGGRGGNRGGGFGGGGRRW